jgi:asparagine synthase (glutamine-hydrolysing)
LLFAAVERQMISDVPLGTFLSGGIDSSLVTAVAAQVRGGGQKLKTFSIGFDEPRFDESEFAGKVATHLHTDHHLFRVSEQDVLELLPRFISVYDEPFADSSAFPTMLVSRLARQHVTVVLSGDGGDELFQGYGMYAWARRLSNPGVRLLRKPAYWLSRIMGERYRRAGNLFCYPNQAHIPSHIFSQEQNLFHEKELKSMLVNPDFDFNPLNNIVDTGLPQERQALWDVQHYLKDDLLVKVDRASMHFGLEVRVPLQDQEFVAFALGLPYRYKVNEGQTKYLLRQILYSFVPQEIFERPKRGFAIPLHKWLKGELKSQVDKYLSGDLVEAAGWVRPAYVRALLARYYKGESYLYNRIWVLLVLHWWYHTECNKEW